MAIRFSSGVDADHAAGRADKSRDEFGQAAGAGTDIEHAIPGLQSQRSDEEFTMVNWRTPVCS
ncbi:hypothetical protein ACVW0J_007395 [Bradyrhizobium sp. i1.7.7]